MVVALLRLQPTTLLAWRNQFACVKMSMGIMRLIKGALAQSCDYTLNGDFNKDLTQFDGSSTPSTIFCKNDKAV